MGWVENQFWLMKQAGKCCLWEFQKKILSSLIKTLRRPKLSFLWWRPCSHLWTCLGAGVVSQVLLTTCNLEGSSEHSTRPRTWHHGAEQMSATPPTRQGLWKENMPFCQVGNTVGVALFTAQTIVIEDPVSSKCGLWCWITGQSLTNSSSNVSSQSWCSDPDSTSEY